MTDTPITFDGFHWDAGNQEKCCKREVSLAEIEQAPRMIRFVVDDAFMGEKRYRTIEGRHVVAEADMTDVDLSQMVPMRLELTRKDMSVSLRLPDALLEAVKRTAARQGIA